MNTEEKLDTLAQKIRERAVLAEAHATAIDLAMGPRLKAVIDEINGSFGDSLVVADMEIERLSAEIRNDVLSVGHSISNDSIQAIFTRPRVDWDSKGLDTLYETLPQIQQFRRVGMPSVMIRKSRDE